MLASTQRVYFRPPHEIQSRQRALRFQASLPWDAMIARNPVLNRLAIDLVGLEAFSIALARNEFERFEKLMDFGFRMSIGWGLPIISGMAVQSLMNQRLKRLFPKAFVAGSNVRVNPLAVPLTWLDRSGNAQRLRRLATQPDAQKILAATGIKNFSALTPALQQQIRRGKIGIMAADLFWMAVKGIVFYWAKNSLTEKRSGKKGFSGEFSYTSEAFRREKTQFYDQNKHRLHMLAGFIGMGANLTLPVAMSMLLRSAAPAAPRVFAKGAWSAVSRLKALIPHFDYTDVIYMTRATILVHALFNWNLGGAITARDNHERREHLLRTGIADIFFFVGDDIISGQVSKAFEKRYGKQLRMRVNGVWQKIPLTHKGPFGLTMAVPYHALSQSMASGKLKHLPAKTKARLATLGRVQFWSGLIGTALGLGISVNLLNNWFTWKRVQREQQKKANAA